MLDPDLIDLTMIPPPMTPDEVTFGLFFFASLFCHFPENSCIFGRSSIAKLIQICSVFQDGVYRVFPGAASAVSTPPTPFADRQSLEAELKALESDASHIQRLRAGMINYNAGARTPEGKRTA